MVASLFLPLTSAIEIGGDDGFELCKADLLYQRPELASRMWNDQPWLYTQLASLGFHIFGRQPIVLRALVIASTIAMTLAIAYLVSPKPAWTVGLASALGILTAGGIATLTYAAMIELPACAWAVVAGAVIAGRRETSKAWHLLSGLIMACAVHIKFTALVFLPGIVLAILVNDIPLRAKIRSVVFWITGFVSAFGFLALVAPSFSIDQLFGSHLAALHKVSNDPNATARFHLGLLLPNPALWLGGLIGMAWLACQKDWPHLALIVGFLLGAVIFAAICQPYWEYYTVQFWIPLTALTLIALRHWARTTALTAVYGMGVAGLPKSGRVLGWIVSSGAAVVALWCGFAAPQMVKELKGIASSRIVTEDPMITELRRLTGRTRWMFTLDLPYAFHAGILVPPELIVLSQKRILATGIDGVAIRRILERYVPGLLLLQKRGELQNGDWRQWLDGRYVLVAQNEKEELWQLSTLHPTPLKCKEDRIRIFGL